MKANFIDKTNGRLYHVTGYSIRGQIYCDGDGEELLGENNIPLQSLPLGTIEEADETITTTVRIGYNLGTRDRDIKGIKQIARKHARSHDGMHERLKNEKKELKNKI